MAIQPHLLSRPTQNDKLALVILDQNLYPPHIYATPNSNVSPNVVQVSLPSNSLVFGGKIIPLQSVRL